MRGYYLKSDVTMEEKPIILFDGVCNFCNASVNFLIKQDKKSVFRFAAFQSKAGKQLAEKYNFPDNDFQSFILIDKGKAYYRSTAGLKVYGKLAWHWKWTQIFWIVPKFLRDAVYKYVARNRYKWFGKKDECMIPSARVRNRFLD